MTECTYDRGDAPGPKVVEGLQVFLVQIDITAIDVPSSAPWPRRSLGRFPTHESSCCKRMLPRSIVSRRGCEKRAARTSQTARLDPSYEKFDRYLIGLQTVR